MTSSSDGNAVGDLTSIRSRLLLRNTWKPKCTKPELKCSGNVNNKMFLACGVCPRYASLILPKTPQYQEESCENWTVTGKHCFVRRPMGRNKSNPLLPPASRDLQPPLMRASHAKCLVQFTASYVHRIISRISAINFRSLTPVWCWLWMMKSAWPKNDKKSNATVTQRKMKDNLNTVGGGEYYQTVNIVNTRRSGLKSNCFIRRRLLVSSLPDNKMIIAVHCNKY